MRKTVRDWFWARSQSFRENRMRAFLSEFPLTPASRILDIGGTDLNWRIVDQPSHVVLLNVKIPQGGYDLGIRGFLEGGNSHPVAPDAPSVEYVLGDGRSVPYADAEFDICFSNSTIEHLGDFRSQQQFAAEVRRVGRGIWLQTPAREFPFEPHWLTPVFHWLPRSWQRKLGRNFTIYGWILRPSREDVAAQVDELRLLTLREMHVLFPDCEIRRERFAGLTKSYIAVRQESRTPAAAT